jgi:aryl-alcohol dehydrogenase-like predicted oxidoreductase
MGGAAGLTGIGAVAGRPEGARTTLRRLPMRRLGRTGVEVTALGIGVAPLGIQQSDPERFERVVAAALDAGITYLDVAPNYGNAEARLGPIMATRREGIFLVTKVEEPTRDGALRQVENSLRLMRTERVDAVHLHNIGGFDLKAVMGKGGALEGLQAARERRLLRFIGVSGHMRPGRFLPPIESGEIDLVMPAMNFVDRHTYNFEGVVLPAARERDLGVVAMKVLGGAKGFRYDEQTPALLDGAYYSGAIRYALALEGVASLVIGMASVEDVRAAVEAVSSAAPLTAEERDRLDAEGRRLAQEWGAHFGQVA